MIEENLIRDAAAIQRILEERARALAQPPETEAALEGVGVVVVRLGTERYGVDMKYVQEIRPLHSLTRVPGTPPFYAGLVNLRGRLYPVLDLHRYLALPETGATENSKLVLVSAAGLEMCLRVDDVLGVQPVAESDVKPLLEASSNRRESISCVTSDLVSILDLDALLSDPKLLVQDEVV